MCNNARVIIPRGLSDANSKFRTQSKFLLAFSLQRILLLCAVTIFGFGAWLVKVLKVVIVVRAL